MEKENIEKIMEEYKSGIQNLEGKNQEDMAEQNRIKLHIERLEEERDELNPITEKSLYEEYNKSIEKAKKELDEFKAPYITPEEKRKIEIAKEDLKTSAIQKLIKADKDLDIQIEETEMKSNMNYLEMKKFNIEYDENHNPINANEYQEMLKISDNLRIELEHLKELKNLCEKNLSELRKPTKEEQEKIDELNDILNKRDDEKSDSNVTASPEDKMKTTSEPEVKPENKKEVTTKTENKPIKEKTASKTKLEELEENKNNLIQEMENEKDPTKKLAIQEMLKTVEEEIEKEKTKPNIRENFQKEVEKGKNKITDIEVNAYKNNLVPVIRYTTLDASEHEFKNVHYEYTQEKKEEVLKSYLSDIYPKMEFNSEEEKQELKKYEKADINIVNLLRNDKESLEEYIALLNGEKQKDENSLEIVYDIRKLSKSNISKEEKANLENCAFEHRHIAKVKKNMLQTIKFAFKGFKERINNSRNIKALPETTELVKNKKEVEGIDPETSKKIDDMIKEKNNSKEPGFKDQYKVNTAEIKFPEISDFDPELAKNYEYSKKYGQQTKRSKDSSKDRE